jgi:hypothetical protein
MPSIRALANTGHRAGSSHRRDHSLEPAQIIFAIWLLLSIAGILLYAYIASRKRED